MSDTQIKEREKERKRKARQSRSNDVKVMLTVFFDGKGVVRHEYAPQGRTVSKEYHLEVLKRLRVTEETTIFGQVTIGCLHHDNELFKIS